MPVVHVDATPRELVSNPGRRALTPARTFLVMDHDFQPDVIWLKWAPAGAAAPDMSDAARSDGRRFTVTCPPGRALWARKTGTSYTAGVDVQVLENAEAA